MGMMSIPFKRQHHVNNVLQHPGARKLAVLGDMSHGHDRGTGRLGEMNQFGTTVANLTWRPGNGVDTAVVHQLNGVQNQHVGLVLACLLQNAPQGGLGQKQQVVQPMQATDQTFRPQSNLIRRLLTAGVQHLASRSGHACGRLQQQGALPYPGITSKQAHRTCDQSSAKNAVKFDRTR